MADALSRARILVLIDVQREYTTPGRPFHLRGIEEPIARCRDLLAHARENQWPVAHIRHIQTGHLFNPDLPYSRFVEGFEPLPHEMVFTKGNLSCFSAAEFARFMETARTDQVFIAGFNAAMCCLSTIVDGFHRGHRFSFVQDASLARPTPHADERQAHIHVTDVISIYADITDTSSVTGRLAAAERTGARA